VGDYNLKGERLSIHVYQTENLFLLGFSQIKRVVCQMSLKRYATIVICIIVIMSSIIVFPSIVPIYIYLTLYRKR